LISERIRIQAYITLLLMAAVWVAAGLDFVSFEHKWNSRQQTYLHFSKCGENLSIFLTPSHDENILETGKYVKPAAADVCQMLSQMRHNNLSCPQDRSVMVESSIRQCFSVSDIATSAGAHVCNYAPKHSPPADMV